MNKQITQALIELETASKKVDELRNSCNHIIVPDDPSDPDSSCGVCSECGQSTGSWYCPKNAPSHRCEYTDQNGEWCIHCGDPEERR